MASRRIRLVAALVAATFGLVGAARPGAARTPQPALTINYFQCYSLGQGRMECEGSVSGGTQPYTYTFTPAERFRSDYGNGDIWMMGYCTLNTWDSQTMTVRDATGATATRTAWFSCGAPV